MKTHKLWWVGCLFAMGLSCGANQSKSVGQLAVESSPTGELDGQLKITLAFSQTMVTDEEIGQVVTGPLQIQPAIDGEAKWQDGKTLVFMPTKSLPISTGYVATVPAGLKAVDGFVLENKHTFEFSTERLTGEFSVAGAAQRANRDQVIELHFNQAVPFSEVEANCRYRRGEESVGVNRSGESGEPVQKNFSVGPKTDLQLDSDWVFQCGESLRGEVGNLGLGDDVEEDFHTYGPLAFIEMKPSGNDIVPQEGKAIELSFTNPLAKPYLMSVSPKIPGFPKRCHSLGDSPPGLSCSAMLNPRTDYKITIKRLSSPQCTQGPSFLRGSLSD